MAAMDDPSKVVNAVVWVSVHPTTEFRAQVPDRDRPASVGTGMLAPRLFRRQGEEEIVVRGLEPLSIMAVGKLWRSYAWHWQLFRHLISSAFFA
jgi:hypothetical protein